MITVNAAPYRSKTAALGCSLGSRTSSTGRTTSTRQVMPNNPFQPKYWLMRPPTIGPSPNAMALPTDIMAIAAPLLATGTYRLASTSPRPAMTPAPADCRIRVMSKTLKLCANSPITEARPSVVRPVVSSLRRGTRSDSLL
ncbi:hypothetical protein D3C76_146130 [compost metagenome]